MTIYLRKWRGPDGRLRRARTYSYLFYVNGVRHHGSLHTRDRRAAELMEADVRRREELKRAGITDPYGDSKERPLAEHIDDFLVSLRARNVVSKYRADREKCLRTFTTHADARHLCDLDYPRASAWIASLRDTGLSARSVNTRYQALRQFGLWLVKARRSQFDPFDGLKPLNEAEDRRHVRRALTAGEAARLVAATAARAIARAGRPHPRAKPQRRARFARTLAKMTRLGEARALIYLLAMGTGLRRGEIRRLKWGDVDLDRERVSIPAASAKSRRAQAVALHPRLVEALRSFQPQQVSPVDPVVPAGLFPNIHSFDADLAAAGIAKVDAEGLVMDFHGLRTSFISWLGASGVHPKVAQALARHASIETTMDRYTDLRLFDMKGAVGALPLPSLAAPAQVASA